MRNVIARNALQKLVNARRRLESEVLGSLPALYARETNARAILECKIELGELLHLVLVQWRQNLLCLHFRLHTLHGDFLLAAPFGMGSYVLFGAAEWRVEVEPALLPPGLGLGDSTRTNGLSRGG